ncbi:glycosyltransferase [Sphingobacterium thalpophilum]|uniref:Glycosyltransferase n=1 Tax=Sphingobacterium thalpophilum TaxID=259 RepID=A0ABV4H8N4_9SPHI
MITASIVTFNTSIEDVDNILDSFGYIKCDYKLFIIDNSPTRRLEPYFDSNPRFRYIFNPDNPGFGASHNLAFDEARKIRSEFHFVINPDAFFKEDVFMPMVEFLKENQNVGMMMPQILNLDGSIQSLPKLLPSPLDVFMRKVKWPKIYYKKFIDRYELRSVNPEMIYEAPILSGCFTLFRMSAVDEIGGYDDRFFMYFEDWDLSRRMNKKYKTIYNPKVKVFHGYESGANKSGKLFKIFIKSAILFFNKWGWFWDKERARINRKTLSQFK